MTASSRLEPSKPITEIYLVGPGDVLFINLRNAPNGAGYYTVRSDGSIDFPLAGENPSVLHKTTAQIEDLLSKATTVYSSPQIEVRVREFASHKITVLGMAERVGERFLQREALPLFVIRTDALVSSAAKEVHIRREDRTKLETYDLRDEKTGDVLVFAGDSVEFTTGERTLAPATSGFFYIAGDVNSSGKREYIDGMTLFQAVTASGGAKGNPRTATLRRKGDKGLLKVAEFDLRAIRDGKQSDPILQPGDMIEITN